MADFDPIRENGESSEHLEHSFIEATLEENWYARFQANGVSYRTLGLVLETETDPLKIAELTAQKAESFIRAIGSGAISLWKDAELAKRDEFEREFGAEFPAQD